MAAESKQPLLEMRNITKSFPGVRALDGVSFDLYAGEVHALVGENGAGKSTLMKVLGGVYPHPEYGGEILINGEAQRFAGIRQAESAGIAVVYQELSLVKDMTVGENIFLWREPRRFGIILLNELDRRAHALLDELHLKIDPRTPVRNLGIGQQQLVEIAKALSQTARILVLDEPTAALTESEVETLFKILDSLRARGVGMIYISHKLDEVFRLSVRINSPSEAIRYGLGFVTEDRKRFGLILDQTILNNMTLASLPHVSGRFVTNADAEAAAGERASRELRVKANNVFTIVGTLSGGNQQKVVLAKWLLTKPRVLFLDEPTRGIDVGAKQEIYAEINKLAKDGLAIVLVSSELPEVLGLADRVVVLYEGRLTGEFTRTEATPEAVMSCATGHARAVQPD